MTHEEREAIKTTLYGALRGRGLPKMNNIVVGSLSAYHSAVFLAVEEKMNDMVHGSSPDDDRPMRVSGAAR